MDKITLTRVSPISGKANSMTFDMPLAVFTANMTGWATGNLCIQDAFPSLTPDEREFIKTGITSEDWDAMFGESDEDYS